jgi:NADPH2:quinone reductase
VTTDGAVFGKTVLVTGGAGAVGAYAIQFARLYGAARIVTTVSSSEKAEICTRLGADHTINYRTEDVVDRIGALTNGRGVDRVIEVDAATNVEMLPGIIARDGLCVI